MTQINDMPKDGQFVAVWNYNNQIWSDTFKWIDGRLYKYAEFKPSEEDNNVGTFCDDFSEPIPSPPFFLTLNPSFFIL